MSDITRAPRPAPAPDRARQARGRGVRRIWRIHFYAALFSAPFLVLLSITGLVILYTAPLSEAMHRDLLVVTPQATSVSLEDQRAAAQAALPDLSVDLVVPPAAPDRSTMVELTDGGDLYQQVFVDPYTGAVLGSMVSGDDVIGLANRLHGSLASDNPTVELPALAHLVDEANPATIAVPLGDVIIEVAAGWGLILAITGVYLWWPRKSQHHKPLLRIRWSKGGRLRWRDVHATGGILLAGLLAFFVVSGMPWSNYWGSDWAAVASAVTPNDEFEAPLSTPVKAGALDRLGNRIPWATREDVIPASDGSAVVPATLSLDAVARIAQTEGMLPGYSIVLPIDDTSVAESPVFGTYQLSNPWPGKVEDEKVVYLDQFTGRTLGVSDPTSWGFLPRATEWGVQNHMGTQYGLATRILMTVGCLLIILSVVTGIVMWWKRRPSGSTGLPKRGTRAPSATSTFVVWGVGILLALVYPLWGVTAAIVVAVDAILHAVRARRGVPA